jgi:hypothetical protein
LKSKPTWSNSFGCSATSAFFVSGDKRHSQPSIGSKPSKGIPMGLLLLTTLTVLLVLSVLLVGGLAIWGRPRRRKHLPPPFKDSRGAINAENVRVNLRYDRADLKSLFWHAMAHDVELDGRYHLRRPPRLDIWTHNWINPGCRAESSLMVSLEFDWNTASLISVTLQPRYDWAIFLDELARLERGALGGVVYGKSRCQPKT